MTFKWLRTGRTTEDDGLQRVGCGPFSAEQSPLVVISATLRYQALRGVMRNLSAERSISASQVHLTSRAVKGLPSCHVAPCRSWKFNCGPKKIGSERELSCCE